MTSTDMLRPHWAPLHSLIAFFALAITLLPAKASAQDAQDTLHAANCARNIAALKRPTEARGMRHAIVNVNTCDGGMDALVSVWSNPPTDEIALAQLGALSGDYRDQRMFDALLATAKSNRSRRQRAAAFSGLVRYCSPSVFVLYRNLDTPNLSAHRYAIVALEARDGPVFVEGPSPLPASACQTVRSTLASLGQGDADPVIREVAGYLITRLDQLTKATSR